MHLDQEKASNVCMRERVRANVSALCTLRVTYKWVLHTCVTWREERERVRTAREREREPWNVRIYLCMYVCLFICMYVCMYVCLFIYIRTIHVFTYDIYVTVDMGNKLVRTVLLGGEALVHTTGMMLVFVYAFAIVGFVVFPNLFQLRKPGISLVSLFLLPSFSLCSLSPIRAVSLLLLLYVFLSPLPAILLYLCHSITHVAGTLSLTHTCRERETERERHTHTQTHTMCAEHVSHKTHMLRMKLQVERHTARMLTDSSSTSYLSLCIRAGCLPIRDLVCIYPVSIYLYACLFGASRSVCLSTLSFSVYLSRATALSFCLALSLSVSLLPPVFLLSLCVHLRFAPSSLSYIHSLLHTLSLARARARAYSCTRSLVLALALMCCC